MCLLLEKNPSRFHLANLVSYTDFKGLLLKNRQHLIHTQAVLHFSAVTAKKRKNT